MYTAKQVHQDFLSAEDRLLNEAKSLIENPRIDAMKKAERLNKLGFTSSKDSKLAEEFAQKSVRANDLLSSIAYFRTYYPGNKFITEEEVKKLCEKYGLFLGGADNYIGDIPERNILQMEAFKLRKEDFVEDVADLGFIARAFADHFHSLQRMSSEFDAFGNRQLIPGTRSSRPIGNDSPAKQKSSKKPAFKMCAPAKEFNTSRLVIEDGYKLVVDDPIVLQPVKGGYLIVTAWGPEASDELVRNEIAN